MGWTWTHRDNGMTTRAFFEAELTGSKRILASGMVDGTFYAAVQNPGDAAYEPGRVWALVCLTGRSKSYFNFGYKDMDEDMGPADARCPQRVLDLLSPIGKCQHEETYCTTCDAEISDDTGIWMTYAKPGQREDVTSARCDYYPAGAKRADGTAPFHTPGGHGYCSKQSAREFRAESAAYNARVKASKAVERGDTVIFPAAFNFTGNYRSDTFTYLTKDTFLMHGAVRVRIPGWKGMRTTVIKAAA